MEASIRPWFTAGVAVVGAGAIALAPVSCRLPGGWDQCELILPG